MPISSSAQIIPSESSPRILDDLIVKGSPSRGESVAPGKATITFCPAATLAAPHTTGMVLSPTLTVVSESLSALGCLPHVMTSPIAKPLSPPGADSRVSVLSTSRPASVRTEASASADSGREIYCDNQLYEIFIVTNDVKFKRKKYTRQRLFAQDVFQVLSLSRLNEKNFGIFCGRQMGGDSAIPA